MGQLRYILALMEVSPLLQLGQDPLHWECITKRDHMVDNGANYAGEQGAICGAYILSFQA
jgi:hypothetical protein